MQRIRGLLPAFPRSPHPVRRSLVNRLLGLLSAGAVLVSLIGVAGLWWNSTRLLEDGMEKQALRWLKELDELGTVVYVSQAKGQAGVIENRIKNFPEIAFVRYYDAAGANVLRQFGWAKNIPALEADQTEALSAITALDQAYLFEPSASGGFARLIAPVHVRSVPSDGMFSFDLNEPEETVQVIGYIDIGLDRSYYLGQLSRNIALGGGMTAVILVIALVIGHRLIRKALAPLTDLQAPLSRLAEGDIDVSVATGGDREIAAIGQALNTTITALKQRDAVLRRLAERDALTGLYNRSCFTRLLETEIGRCRRAGAASALLFIDLDRFKYVNDILGHAGGDRLLVRVADLLRRRMREEDVVARFGGDEFALIVRNASREGAVEVAKSIGQTMREFDFVEQGQAFDICCSIGIAMIDATCRDGEEAMLRADAACFEAKSAGRNRYHVSEAGETQPQASVKEVGWSRRIRQMLREDGFKLLYQPIAAADDGRIECYEVLLRMPDREGNLISPSMFLPVAERFGLLSEIDRWVIVRAMRVLADIRGGGRHISFSINLSGRAIEDAAIADLIEETRAECGVPASAVIFEITEQVAMQHLDKARRVMQRLVDCGFRFALDDFGAGFSSFHYLKHLPASYIKIDGNFIENIPQDPVDLAMVQSITQVAHALGKRTIAESVQSAAAVEALARCGVDFLQGYHIGKPAEAPVTAPGSTPGRPLPKSAAAER